MAGTMVKTATKRKVTAHSVRKSADARFHYRDAASVALPTHRKTWQNWPRANETDSRNPN